MSNFKKKTQIFLFLIIIVQICKDVRDKIGDYWKRAE
jgi:hypothetical protein